MDRKLVTQLATCEFTAAAHNVVLVGGRWCIPIGAVTIGGQVGWLESLTPS